MLPILGATKFVPFYFILSVLDNSIIYYFTWYFALENIQVIEDIITNLLFCKQNFFILLLGMIKQCYDIAKRFDI